MQETSEYQLLCRVMEEQCRIDENGKYIPKEDKEFSPQYLHNPSEPDATFRRKAGKKHLGYVANIVETTGEENDSLITDISFEQNSHNDSEFCREYLESRDENAAPELMVTDGAYSSAENFKLAEKKNVELVCTALTGALPAPIFSKFEMSEDGKSVLRCPEGHEPVRQKFNERTESCSILMSSEHCEKCPHRDECKGKKQKNGYALNVSAKKVGRARYMQKISTEEYKKIGRLRNAVEGIPSVLRRKYHVDEIPVFGLQAKKTFFEFKVLAYNFCKFLRSRRRTQMNCAQMQITG